MGEKGSQKIRKKRKNGETLRTTACVVTDARVTCTANLLRLVKLQGD